MTVAGDIRNGRNPQKAGVAFTAALWAGNILAAEAERSVAVSLPGGFLAEHMAELLSFDRRIFYELDADQFEEINRARHDLGGSYTDHELRKTQIVQDNIFNDSEASAAPGAYYDWDITGTIKEAEKYGLNQAILSAVESSGTRCMALTVSLRRAGRDYSINRWKILVRDAVARVPNRVVTFEPEIVYGGIYRKTATMMLLRAVVRDGGEAYDKRRDKLENHSYMKTIKRAYSATRNGGGSYPSKEVMIARILAHEFHRSPRIRVDKSGDLRKAYRAAGYTRGSYPSEATMIKRIKAPWRGPVNPLDLEINRIKAA